MLYPDWRKCFITSYVKITGLSPVLIEYKYYFSTWGGRGGPTLPLPRRWYQFPKSSVISFKTGNRHQPQLTLGLSLARRSFTMHCFTNPVERWWWVGQDWPAVWSVRYYNVAADAHHVVTDVTPNWLNINCTSAGQKVQTTVNFMIQFPSNLIIISLNAGCLSNYNFISLCHCDPQLSSNGLPRSG